MPYPQKIALLIVVVISKDQIDHIKIKDDRIVTLNIF